MYTIVCVMYSTFSLACVYTCALKSVGAPTIAQVSVCVSWQKMCVRKDRIVGRMSEQMIAEVENMQSGILCNRKREMKNKEEKK